ncbi:hypothetical protein MSG28_013497 [Choristoneura fumiferana]|uniref:Uncharacterized protein n=1 Tax=Choristoneura fumiferana TaxID=7141 RepID=A0ACC0KU75_CHOFU|nr:hypothetical protein MSG28_013497 [Choristoneura fumiferana]
MSQRRSTRAGAPAAPIEEEEDDSSLEEAVNECTRYILCREASKLPIKRADIAKHLATVCQTPSGVVSRVILRTDKLLEKMTCGIFCQKLDCWMQMISPGRRISSPHSQDSYT